jgi:CRISPR/Cas system-associated exonuclease Cas4 (RecB family)
MNNGHSFHLLEFIYCPQKHYEKVYYLNSAIANISSSERSPGGINSRRKGHLKPQVEELRRLKRENERLRRERDILKKPWPSSQRTRTDIRVHSQAPHSLEYQGDVPRIGGVSERILKLAQTSREPTGDRKNKIYPSG